MEMRFQIDPGKAKSEAQMIEVSEFHCQDYGGRAPGYGTSASSSGVLRSHCRGQVETWGPDKFAYW